MFKASFKFASGNNNQNSHKPGDYAGFAALVFVPNANYDTIGMII